MLRVRPKAMTVAVILAGLLPIMWSHGTGSEVMQRIAAPMVGGMVTAPLLVFLYDRTFVGGSFRAAWAERRKFHATLALTWAVLGALLLSGSGRGGTAVDLVRSMRSRLWPTAGLRCSCLASAGSFHRLV